MEENKLDFFGDISSRLFLIGGGIISLTTFIPQFLNSLEGIFGLTIEHGFWLFVFLYFIFPIAFYLVYCSITDYIGFVKLIPLKIWDADDKSRARLFKLRFFEVASLLIFWILIALNATVSIIPFLLMWIASLFIIFYLYKPRQGYTKIRGDWKEFRVISVTIFIVFTVFLGFNLFNIWNTSSSENDLRNSAYNAYTSKDYIDDYITKPVDSFVNKYREKVLHTLMQYPNSDIANIPAADSEKIINAANIISLVLNPDSIYSKSKYQQFGNDLLDAIKKIDDKELQQYRNYESYLSLQEYVHIKVQEKENEIGNNWAALMSFLKWKGLMWLYFIIILLLRLWLYNQKELSKKQVKYSKIQKALISLYSDRAKYANPSNKINSERVERLIAVREKSKIKEEKDIVALTDNAGQVKNLFYIVVLLIIPFFKPINKDTINLNKPFLNTGVSDLFSNGILIKNTPVNSETVSQLKIINERVLELSNKVTSTNNRLDTMSKDIIYDSVTRKEYDSLRKK